MEPRVRQPAVAGVFYPASPASLGSMVERLTVEATTRHDLLACIAPHAGYVYSGSVAGKMYGHLRLPRRVVLLGPNHTGLGAAIAVAPEASWHTPLGDPPLDRELGNALIGAFPDAREDAAAHLREHALEVHLPFLQMGRPDVVVLPICLGHLSLATCEALGGALAEVIRGAGEPVGIVASSDMTHYEPDEVARDRDRLAIDAALGLDPRRLYETVHAHRITMCGVVPATVAIAAARVLGATGAHLVDYATSGDVSGDRSSVVGYAGICFHRED
jgi:MEMO1 family protein